MSVKSGLTKSLSRLSMIGRALMLPISLLPAAGLLLAASIVQELERRQYMVFLGHPQNNDDALERCLLSFEQQGVAGVIYLTSDVTTDALPEKIRCCPLPVVVVSQSLPFP